MQIPSWLSSIITALVAVLTLVAYYMAAGKVEFLKSKSGTEKTIMGAGIVALSIFATLIILYFVNTFGTA